MLSDRVRQKILQQRIRGTRQYEIARRANLHPTVLSALLNGAIRARRDDQRIARLAAALGLTEADCFEAFDHD